MRQDQFTRIINSRAQQHHNIASQSARMHHSQTTFTCAPCACSILHAQRSVVTRAHRRFTAAHRPSSRSFSLRETNDLFSARFAARVSWMNAVNASKVMTWLSLRARVDGLLDHAVGTRNALFSGIFLFARRNRWTRCVHVRGWRHIDECHGAATLP